jgi:septal ring factor EnvC (AmiA/AmiB activator)
MHPARQTRIAVVGVGILIVLGVLAVTAGAQQAERAQLSEARERIAAIEARLDEATQQEQSAEDELRQAEEALTEVEAILNEVALDVERQRGAVADAQRRVASVEAEASELEEAFEARIARLYMQGPELSFELLLSSSGADEAIARTTLLERVTEGDTIDLERLAAASRAVTIEQQRLADEQRELEDRLAEQEEVRAEADALRRSRAGQLSEARQTVGELTDRQDELENEEARLEALIQRLEREAQEREAEQRRAAERRAAQQAAASAPSASPSPAPAPAPTPRASGGGYAWPMCGPVTSEYGPRWGRVHRGLDLGGPIGTPIRAAKAGQVVFAGRQGGYGNLVLINHGDGVTTAYAHLSRFAVSSGSSVGQGQTIGAVGMTGNTTGPHLHFETRVNGRAVNPRQYLSGSPC